MPFPETAKLFAKISLTSEFPLSCIVNSVHKNVFRCPASNDNPKYSAFVSKRSNFASRIRDGRRRFFAASWKLKDFKFRGFHDEPVCLFHGSLCLYAIPLNEPFDVLGVVCKYDFFKVLNAVDCYPFFPGYRSSAFEVYLREPAERHVVNKFLAGVFEFDALPVRHFQDCDEQGVVVVRYERVSAPVSTAGVRKYKPTLSAGGCGAL